MKEKKIQARNDLNIFLNEYFSAIVFAIAIFILIFSFIFFISPKLKITKNAIRDNIAIQQKLYGEQEKKLNELKTIKSVYTQILPADLDKFNQVLPSNYVKESLYGELEEIVAREGFGLTSIEIMSEEQLASKNASKKDVVAKNELSPNIGEINFIIGIRAVDYRGLKRVINRLESSSRLFDIQMLEFSEKDSVAELTVATYYYKD